MKNYLIVRLCKETITSLSYLQTTGSHLVIIGKRTLDHFCKLLKLKSDILMTNVKD